MNSNFEKVHHIKLYEDFADDVLNGRKNFEIRENDRGYQTGDKVKFTVVYHSGLTYNHKLNDRIYEITYVLSGWGLKDNYVVFGIKDITESESVGVSTKNVNVSKPNNYTPNNNTTVEDKEQETELFYCYDCPYYDIVLDYCSKLDDYACIESCPLSDNEIKDIIGSNGD